MRRACLAWALVLPALVLAAKDAQDKKATLRGQQGELREKIESIRHDLAKSEETRAFAADQLKEVETAISDANRGLRQLGEQRGVLQTEARELEAESRRLDQKIRIQQDQLSGLLYRQFVRGESDPLQVQLAGRDPNQAALEHEFLKRLSVAKAVLIADLRAITAEKKRLTKAVQEKNSELIALEGEQRQARSKLVDQQKTRQGMLARSTDKIKAQRREIGALQRDEKRLSKLIEGLNRTVVHRNGTRHSTVVREPEASAVAVAPSRDPLDASGAFAALRGRLPVPVKGEIAARFGKPRPEGGTTWKGLFIRAPEGTEVHAIAAGEVVYAEWLRGFGNLLIVDHGDAFLSVYGNNQSLFKVIGENVKAGEAIATVGSSGGNPESGLYFEIRHQGQAFDPLRWLRQPR